ncbi:MAG: PQQ-binding-like beta-propeller repeat protein [Actinobacteria bacterium]|nr:PQQ-binding-like beta-propeller repeat protein [Actinomycetota bacterium]
MAASTAVVAVVAVALITATRAPGLDVRWRLVAGGPLVGAPVATGDSVYVTTRDGSLVAADSEQGRARWRFETGEQVRTGPVVGSGLVYMSTESADGAGGHVYAVDGRTGAEQWRLNAEGVPVGAPAVSEGSVYVSAGDLVALDAVTGAERWRRTVVGAGAMGAGAGVALTTTPVGLIALDAATGDEVWSWASLAPPQVAPVVAGKSVVTDDGAGGVVSLSVTDGALRWRVPTAGLLQAPEVAGDGLVVATANGVVALETASGEERWRVGPSDSDRLRVASDGFSVAATSTDVVILDAASGDDRGRAALATSTLAAPALARGIAYVGAGDTVEAFVPPVP